MSERIDFATLERPSSPNTYLVAPAGLCTQTEPDAVSPVFSLTPHRLFEKLLHFIEIQPRCNISVRDDENHYVAAIAKTRWLGFKDDVALQAFPAGDQKEKSQLAVYSRSRVGYHDFGVNRKRVELLIKELNQYGETTV